MKRRIAIGLLLLVLATPALAQDSARVRDSVNVELLGKGFVFSLNGEVGLGDRFALGAGIGPVEDGDDPGQTLVFPMHLSWVSHRTHGLYLAVGATYVYNSESTEDDSELHATLTWGGQLSIRRGYLRFAITHFDRLDEHEDQEFWDWVEPVFWPGITVGVRF